MHKERRVLETDRGEERDGTMHTELWKDANTMEGCSALYVTKEMT